MREWRQRHLEISVAGTSRTLPGYYIII